MYMPLDDARVTIEVRRADSSLQNDKGSTSPVQAVVSSERPGQYDGSYFTARQAATSLQLERLCKMARRSVWRQPVGHRNRDKASSGPGNGIVTDSST